MTTNWPPNYKKIIAERFDRIDVFSDPRQVKYARAYYRTRPVEFIEHWCNTYDPRKAATGLITSPPFILFDRQKELVGFLDQLVRGEENGLIEKARDMGATWVCCGFSVWLWSFHPGASVGWGSRKEQLVDKIGDPDSIFEKLRMLIKGLPFELIPAGFDPKTHVSYMKIINPENGASITGEAGDNIGRGGRKLIYFKDESAHYMRPEMIEAALADNTNVQVDISSVNGLGNVFQRRREAGAVYDGEIVPNRTNVFVMDWRDHPEKTQEWYDKRKNKALEEGLLHIFKQEVDRDYAASVEGVLIPVDWFDAAIDAHIKLKFGDDGARMAALDVADGGGDKNAYSERKSIVLTDVQSWAEGDTGYTTRKAVGISGGNISIQYDCIGVGAGVKAEANRLDDESLLPEKMSFYPWNAGASVLNPDDHLIPDDEASPKQKDFFENLKAQASWMIKLRFERTFMAVTAGQACDPADLISISSDIPKSARDELRKELAQITVGQSARLRVKINKKPEGTKSPNLADSVIMNYFPMPKIETYNLDNL